ncbi:MAG: M13 family metallopeptidase, partial [Acidobacteriota bacterium]|nr:M13 family metallopeptidase [Acidobacteriota bacterium]
ARLREVLEAAAAGGSQRTAERRRLGDYYAACMDEAGAERRGLSPLEPDLRRIAALKSAAELPPLLAHLDTIGAGALFSLRSGQDAKDALQVIAVVDQGGLGLPDRDFYLKTDAKSADLRQKYADHLKRMFGLMGEPAERAAADAAAVLAIETTLAKASIDRVSRRDPYKVYHKLTRAELAALTPSFSWDAFLQASGAPPAASFNVVQPDFLRAMDELLRTLPIEQWRSYLRWHLVKPFAEWLPGPWARENFAFVGATLAGARQERPRWERCVEATDRALGDDLGQEYIATSLDPATRDRTLALVAELQKAMGQDIGNLSWMSEETRQQARTKLQAIARKIAYPEARRDYSQLAVDRTDLLGNVERAAALEQKRRLGKIGKPLDRLDWTRMTPSTANASYNSSLNDITIPAGILQVPFYDPRRDDAMNYGAIGAVVGHELSHGFDDHGRQFDAHGNLEDWWTAADGEQFKQRAACLVDEYSSFAVPGDLKVNGRLTLGENVADNGGIRIAYMAYQASQAGKPRRTLDGLTPEQRFFIGFGQIWCTNSTPQAERMQVLTNEHSPGRFRTNGVVANLPEFQEAFHCKAGAPMAPANRCRVW